MMTDLECLRKNLQWVLDRGVASKPQMARAMDVSPALLAQFLKNADSVPLSAAQVLAVTREFELHSFMGFTGYGEEQLRSAPMHLQSASLMGGVTYYGKTGNVGLCLKLDSDSKAGVGRAKIRHFKISIYDIDRLIESLTALRLTRLHHFECAESEDRWRRRIKSGKKRPRSSSTRKVETLR
jgi:hypothetical protein